MDCSKTENTKEKTMPKVTRKVMEVTPEMAIAWLNNLENSDRFRCRVCERTVASYAASMTAGTWIAKFTPVLIDAYGVVIDGQHRLWAVVKCGFPQRMTVTKGASWDCLLTVDDYRCRPFGDCLRMLGIKNYKYVATTVRAYRDYERRVAKKSLNSKIVNQNAWSIYLDNREDYDRAARIAHRNWLSALMGGSGNVGTFAYATYQIDPELSDYFFDAFKEKEYAKLGERDPIRALRGYLMSELEKPSEHRMSSPSRLASAVKAWNVLRVGGNTSRQRLTLQRRFVPAR
jgi:hypothetical protein